MRIIEIYTKSWCPYSTLAKQLLDLRGLDYHELDGLPTRPPKTR